MSLRVIAGSAKGFPLKMPKGTPTRPATELVRGAIFSILASSAENWGQVLDLFSGSGSLGIEALSRGAGFVDFVDQDARCCATIKENLEKTLLSPFAKIHRCNVTRAIATLSGPYDIVLMDPPYSDSNIGKVLLQLADSSIVDMSTTVVMTHSSRLALLPSYSSLKIQREYRHGDSMIAILRKEI